MSNFTIKQLPEEERPRERLERFGAATLSSSELIAVLLGSGTKGKTALQLAQEILQAFGSLSSLSEATLEELVQFKGLGKAKAIQLKAALSLSSRVEQTKEKKTINKPHDAYILVKEHLIKEKREFFGTILQNAKGKVICCETISIGTLTQTLVHPREVFYPAIRHQAASLILYHNHPSGDLTPSSDDLRVTNLLIDTGKIMGIPIVDHIIVSFSGFLSLREEGLCSF